MREEGIVTNYNGYEGEIHNEKGLYALLRDDIQREDRDIIKVGDEVEFESLTYKSTAGSFSVARNVRVTNKKESSLITIFKKRTLSKTKK